MTEKSLPGAAPPEPAQREAGVGARANGRWRFWVVTLATGLAVAVTASLGQWQLGRAAQKNSLAEQRDAREALPALAHDDVAALVPALLAAGTTEEAVVRWHDRSATLRGQWVPDATVFLENRTMAGRVGFLVVTPLRLETAAGSDSANDVVGAGGAGGVLLVQRGWVPRSFEDRTALPEVPTPEYPIEVSGRLAPPPSKLYEFEAGPAGQIRQNIHLAAFAQEWSLPLLPLTLQQGAPQVSASGTPDDLLRDWPRVGHDVHKHYGYALQWFGLCALLVILYVWFQLIAPGRRQR